MGSEDMCILFEDTLKGACVTYLTTHFCWLIIMITAICFVVFTAVGLLFWRITGTLFSWIFSFVSLVGLLLAPFCGDRLFIQKYYPNAVRFCKGEMECSSQQRYRTIDTNTVRKVTDHGTFYSIHTPLVCAVCPKKAITKGDVQSFEELWGDRLVRGSTISDEAPYCDVRHPYYIPMTAGVSIVIGLLLCVIALLGRTYFSGSTFVGIMISGVVWGIVSAIGATLLLTRKIILSGSRLTVYKCGRKKHYDVADLTCQVTKNKMNIVRRSDSRVIAKIYSVDYDAERIVEALKDYNHL